MNRENETLVQQATRWYARLRAPDCSAAEREQFQRWLARNAAHAHAYEAAVRTADSLTKQIQVDPRLRALADAALAKPVAIPSNRFKAALHDHWRSAAMFLVSVGVAALVASQLVNTDVSSGATTMASYQNEALHERRIVLEDGSILHLDVDSQVDVVMNVDSRRLQLNRGRAYFEVAHDASRPFSVTAAGTRTVALGTRFEVAVWQRKVSITLAQGSVAVTPADGAVGSAAQWREVLQPGELLQINNGDAARSRRQVNTTRIADWSTGRLVFDGTPLSRVLDEINRYASVKIRLGDAALADVPIGGSFVAGGDSIEFVETLAAVLPLRSVRAGANEIVLFQRYETRNP